MLNIARQKLQTVNTKVKSVSSHLHKFMQRVHVYTAEAGKPMSSTTVQHVLRPAQRTSQTRQNIPT